MLEKIPAGLGKAMGSLRSGAEKLSLNRPEFIRVPETISVTSPAFIDHGRLPPEYTADGEGQSPPLEWRGIPEAAHSLVLLVEDADSPTPNPLVHAIAWNLPAADDLLSEGALPSPHSGRRLMAMGLSSAFKPQYLPPDPPSGHGDHRYVFQVFAVDEPLHFEHPPGRDELLDALEGHVLAKGQITALYARS